LALANPYRQRRARADLSRPSTRRDGSLFYGRNDVRLIGYDNEAGKGDHRHHGDREEVYQFTTPEKLMLDFLADVRAIRRRRTD
jgi:uncharacterized protein DUF6516